MFLFLLGLILLRLLLKIVFENEDGIDWGGPRKVSSFFFLSFASILPFEVKIRQIKEKINKDRDLWGKAVMTVTRNRTRPDGT